LCNYERAFVVTEREGRLLLWCASCRDQAGLAALLPGGSRVAPTTISRPNPIGLHAAKNCSGMTLWHGAVPCPATLAATYLSARSLPGLATSPALRLHHGVRHPNERGLLPAMLALVVANDGVPLAIHRTYLSSNGTAKAEVEPVRASLGRVWGGAIRLDPAAAEIVIGEGVETAASAGLLLGLPAWSAISAGNMARGLLLPPEVRAVVIAADHDEPGLRAATTAAARWSAEGRAVRVAIPDRPGFDFNDLLQHGETRGWSMRAKI
jgi:putative DNA primase/helicase